jgi:hypothetical protein
LKATESQASTSSSMGRHSASMHPTRLCHPQALRQRLIFNGHAIGLAAALAESMRFSL